MDDDERQEEMDCIAAIYPETIFDPQDPFTATIEVPVNPQSPVKVIFPAASDGTIATALINPPPNQDEIANNIPDLESHNLAYLPSVQLRIALPEGYPAQKPAKFELSTSPLWLSRTHLDELEATGEQMWEEAGRSLVVYGFIDSLQQAAENAFGFAESGKVLEVSSELKISLLDYDIKARQQAFEKETFDCGVCLDPKKGTVCHKMNDCGHVFCRQCLQDFYNNAIKEGDLVSVKCLDPSCAKERAARQGRKKSKVQLGPSELLQIPLDHEMVTRYVKLKHKAELESDKNTIYCPRKWCQGAARSKKHRKPNGLEDTESEDDEEDDGTNSESFAKGKDLLAVCEDCSFAFCSRCYQGWHGEFTVCIPQTATGEMTEEDKASLEYLKLHSTPCPTCASRAQKTHGCNHMICFKCNSHFCYLCSAWLEAGNPYKHYNEDRTMCYMKLWELEEGDGDADDLWRDQRARALRDPGNEEDEDVVEHVDIDPAPQPIPARGEEPQAQPQRGLNAPALEREGPLILRINQLPPRPVPVVAPVAEPRRQHRQAQNNRGGGPVARRRQPQQQQQQPRFDERGNIILNGNGAGPGEDEEARQRWVQMFVQMALNDEEDLVEWEDGEEDHARWDIPVGR